MADGELKPMHVTVRRELLTVSIGFVTTVVVGFGSYLDHVTVLSKSLITIPEMWR